MNTDQVRRGEEEPPDEAAAASGGQTPVRRPQANEFCRVLVREISVAEDWEYVQDVISALLRIRHLAGEEVVPVAMPAPPPAEEARHGRADTGPQGRHGRSVEEELLADQRAAVSPPRHLLGCLAQEWKRCDKEQVPFSVLSIALDNFGEHETRRGRTEAGTCLRSVAGTVRGLCLRRRDRVFHRSNGTFVAVLPRTFPDGARCVAERIAHGVRGLGLILPEPEAEAPVVTVSVGVAGSLPAPDLKPADILRQADQVLEAALRTGHGCVLPEFPRSVHRVDLRRFLSSLRPGGEHARRRRTDWPSPRRN